MSDQRSPGMTVAAVARRLGIAPATLRTWDRRYGLGPSQHAAGSHRRYSSTDVARLERMRLHVISGVAPGDAAREALAWNTDHDLEGVVAGGRPGGGHVVPIPGGTPTARGLARAAMALDGDACSEIVTETVDRRGVVWTWDHLIAPVLNGIGQKWEQTGNGLEVEHVLSEAVQSSLSALVTRSVKTSPSCVLLACVEAELHALALWAVAAGLAERSVVVRMLGARTPGTALAQAMKRTGPGAVMLWSQTRDTGDLAYLTHVPDVRPEPLVVLGGPGWPPVQVPGYERVGSLSEAIAVLARAAGA